MRNHFSLSRFFPLFVILLIDITVGIVILQTLRITPLIDYSYQVENAYRIFQGDIPYKDYFLVLPPGTYVLMAAVMKLTNGYSHIGQIGLTVGISFFTILLTTLIMKRQKESSKFLIATVLLLLVFTGQSIYPFPLYDFFAVLFILLHLYLFILFKESKRPMLLFTVGILATLPSYFKQNIGLVYEALIILSWIIPLIRFPVKKNILFVFYITCGMVASHGLFLLYLVSHGALNQFYYQTFVFPKAAKNTAVEMNIILGQYQYYFSLLRSFLSPIFILTLFIAVSDIIRRKTNLGKGSSGLSFFFRTLPSNIITISAIGLAIYLQRNYSFLSLYNDTVLCLYVSAYLLMVPTTIYSFFHTVTFAEAIEALFPITLIGAMNATYLSHHIVGSSYSLWPLLAIMIPIIINLLYCIVPWIRWQYPVSVLVVFVVFQQFLYVKGNNYYEYIKTDGDIVLSKNSRLFGLSTPGPWIPRMESMINYVDQNIPQSDRVAFLPSEDPFFAVTGRHNPIGFSQMNDSTYPVHPAMIQEIYEKQIPWLIIKTKFQLSDNLSVANPLNPVFSLQKYYEENTVLDGYVIYKRRGVY